MKSFGRFRNLRQIDDSETQSYIVFDPKRDRDMFLHILPPERAKENAAVWDRLKRCSASTMKTVLERGDFLGSQFFVTETAESFSTLIEMLERSPEVRKEKLIEQGEFTRLFQPSTAQTSPAAQPPKSAETGNLRAASEKVTAPTAPVSRPDAPLQARESSDFATYHQEPFGKGSGDIDINRRAPEPARTPEKKPGSFTQTFGQPFSREAKPAQTAGRTETEGATGVFSPRTRTAPAFPQHTVGQSEYTRIIQRTKPGEGTNPESSSGLKAVIADTSQPASASIPAWILAVLGFLAALAIALILYFILKN